MNGPARFARWIASRRSSRSSAVPARAFVYRAFPARGERFALQVSLPAVQLAQSMHLHVSQAATLAVTFLPAARLHHGVVPGSPAAAPASSFFQTVFQTSIRSRVFQAMPEGPARTAVVRHEARREFAHWPASRSTHWSTSRSTQWSPAGPRIESRQATFESHSTVAFERSVMRHEPAFTLQVLERLATIRPVNQFAAMHSLVRLQAARATGATGAPASWNRWFVSTATASLHTHSAFASRTSSVSNSRVNFFGSTPPAIAIHALQQIHPSVTRMILSTRPGQVLAPAQIGYVFAQPARQQAGQPAPPPGSGRQEIVEMVQKEIRNVMSSGTVAAQLTRFDFARIADQVESLLNRRLVIDRERLGLPSR
jgi:hypothetical protein